MRASGFGFVAPLLVVMVVAFNLPIAYMLGLAFWEKGRGFTLEHYEGLAEAPVYLRVLGNTMRISLIATLANVAIGYPLAHWMRGLSSRGRMVALAMVVLPFFTTYLIRTIAWRVIIDRDGVRLGDSVLTLAEPSRGAFLQAVRPVLTRVLTRLVLTARPQLSPEDAGLMQIDPGFLHPIIDQVLDLLPSPSSTLARTLTKIVK